LPVLVAARTFARGRNSTNEPDGQGTAFFYDKSEYAGQWENGKMHGNGVLRTGFGDE
jgi:hypothetical protein